MSTSGPGIFSDDLAVDLRNEFRDLVADGLSPEEATGRLKAEFESSLDDPDERTTFYLALAATQWKTGRVDSDVQAQAISIIETGEDIDRLKSLGADPAFIRGRKSALIRLRKTLREPPPPPTKLKKRYRQETSFEVGDVIQYQRHDGDSVLLAVCGHQIDKGGVVPVLFEVGPVNAERESARRIKKRVKAKRKVVKHAHKLIVFRSSKKDFPEDRLTVVVRKAPAAIPGTGGVVTWWSDLDEQLDWVAAKAS